MAGDYGYLKVGVLADTSKFARSVNTEVSKVGDSAAAGFGDHFEKSSRGFGSRLGGVLKKGAIAVGAGAAAAGAALIPMFKTGMAANEEWERQQANLQAGLKSTHNAANTSVKGMQDLASSISGYSGQSGLAIQNAEQLLLTFPNIRNEAGKNNDIFNQTTKITADMAQRLGKDAPSAAIMLGKALNDPIKGVGALRRVGVQLNDQQTEQVKKLVESGHTMQAQKIIIGELNHEFGGSARMYGKTLPGQIDIMKNSFKGAEREMVATLSPALTKIVGVITKDVLPAFQTLTQNLGPMFNQVLPVLGKAIGSIAKELAPVLGQIVKSVAPVITQIVQLIEPLISQLAPVLGRVFSAIASTLGDVLAGLAPFFKALTPYLGLLGRLLGNLLVGALKALQPLWKPLGQVMALIVQVTTRLMRAIGPLIPVIIKLASQLIKALMPGITAILSGLKPLIPPIIQIVKVIANQLVGVIKMLMPLLKPLGQLIAAALSDNMDEFALILKMVTPLIVIIAKVLGGALKIALKILVPILTAVMKAMTWFYKLIGTVIRWIMGGSPGLVPAFRALGKIAKAIWDGIKAAVQFAWKGIKAVWDGMQKAIDALGAVFRWLWRKVIEPAWDGIKKAINVVWGFIKRSIFAPIHKAVNSLADAFRWFWHRVIVPVWDGVKGAFKAAWNWIKKNVWTPFQNLIHTVAGVFRWFWHKAVEPIWDGVKAAFKAAWNWIKRNIWTPFQNMIHTVADVFRDFWHRAIKPVWDGIKSVFRTAWNFIKNNIFQPMHDALDKLGDAMRFLWHKVIKPVWDGIKGAINTVWGFIRDKIFAPFRGAADKITDAFRGMKDTLKTIWNGLKSIIAVPARFAAFDIINPLLKGANLLLDKIGLHVPLIPKFAEGGQVPGGWGGGDRQLILAEPGEWVLTKKQARGIGYGTLASLPRFAEGGLVGGNGNGAAAPSPFGFFDWVGGAVDWIGSHARSAWDTLTSFDPEQIWNAAEHLFRYTAAKAFEAITWPLKKLAEPWATATIPPNFFKHAFGQWVLDTISKTVAWIWGKSETSPEVTAVAGAIADKAVDVATKQIGKPYVFGAHGPNTFDCSGLVEYSYRMAGYPNGKIPGPKDAIGHTTYQQVNHGRKVNENSAIPGDIVLYFRPGMYPKNPHHVAIATSAREVIQAPDVGMNVMRSAPFAAAGMRGDRRMVRRLVEAAPSGSLGDNYPATARGVWSALRDVGMNAAQAAGVMGNMQSESGFNPFIIQGGGTSKNPHDAGAGGYGLVQWTPGSKLSAILAWGHKQNTLANQVWALNEQLHGRGPVPEGAAGQLLFSVTKNPIKAARMFEGGPGWGYERHAGGAQEERLHQARAIWDRFHKYDRGGWLLPGVNLTENMTRKPEPVLTNDQWNRLTAAATANRSGGGTHYIAGGSLDIGADSQGRLRAWVQDLILDQADYDNTTARRGGGGW